MQNTKTYSENTTNIQKHTKINNIIQNIQKYIIIQNIQKTI